MDNFKAIGQVAYHKPLTKTARIKCCQALIDRQTFDQLWSETDLKEFYEITGIPALAAIRTKNLTWPSDPRHVRVQILDGVWEGVSWKDAINGCNQKTELKKILRGEIADDLADFLSAIEPPKICALCKCICTYDDPKLYPTTDHKGESFDSIALAFIALHDQIKIAAGPQGSCDIIADRDLAAGWIQFHASRAVYQVACRSCNASKGKNLKDTARNDDAVKVEDQHKDKMDLDKSCQQPTP
jgi:hypothetical protein